MKFYITLLMIFLKFWEISGHPKYMFNNFNNKTGIPITLAVKPTELITILKTQRKFRFEDPTNFTIEVQLLEEFPRFLVFYDRDIELDELLKSMDATMTAAVEYNKAHADNIKSSPVKLWVAFHQKGNVEAMLTAILRVVHQANSKFPHTVTRVLLNFYLLTLGSDTLPIVKDDIKICNRLASSHNSPNHNLTCGVMFDCLNCLEEPDQFTELPLIANNNVVFSYMDSFSFEKEADRYSLRKCVEILKSNIVKSAVQCPGVIHINENNMTYWYKPLGKSMEREFGQGKFQDDWEVILLNVNFTGKNSQRKSPSSAELDGFDQRLLKPIEFNKIHFGIYLDSSSAPEISQEVGLQMFSTFRKFIISSSNQSSAVSIMQYLGKMTNAMAIVTAALLPSRDRPSDNAPPVQLFLKLPQLRCLYQAENKKRELAENVFSMAKKASDKQPGIVTTILTSYGSPCFQRKWRNKFGAFTATTNQLDWEEYLEIFEELHKLKKSSKGNTIEIGFVFTNHNNDMLRVKDPSRTFDDEPENSTFLPYITSVFRRIDVLVLESTIHVNKLKAKGALHNAEYLVYEFEFDIRQIKNSFDEEVVSKAVFAVRILGCHGNSTDLHELSEVVLFMKILNNWAVKENRTVFIDTAFQFHHQGVQAIARQNNCDVMQDLESSLPSGCTCGWWHVKKEEDGQTAQISDKLQILRQRYQELHPELVQPPPQEEATTHFQWTPVIMPTAVILVVAAVALVCVAVYFKSQYTKIIRRDIQQFFRGTTNVEENEKYKYHSQPYNKEKYEVAVSSFDIDMEQCLGSGEYSSVYKATIKRLNNEIQSVAVKLNNRINNGKSHQDHLAFRAAISEIKVLAFVDDHQHIIKLIGAHTEKMYKGQIFIFLEFCSLGSLEKYLRCQSPPTGSKKTPSLDVGLNSSQEDIKTSALSAELSQDLFRWGEEIACGMEYLTAKKLVHLDLATRNVLLDSSKCAKISDFGLSRRLYEYSEYCKQQQAPLPWRWMAPESLRKMIFNEKTDVWAYGVTLWEMYTLGDIPYGGMSYEISFTAMIAGGMQLEEPKYNEKGMYKLMQNCWEVMPGRRPTFAEIKERFRQ